MWVIFRKSDKKVIGRTAHSSSRELEKGFAITEVLSGRLKGAKAADFDAIQVRDPAEVSALQGAGFGQEVVIEQKEDGSFATGIRGTESFQLSLQTDAESFHPVDDVPLVPADGKSITEVTIQKIDDEQKPVARRQDDDQLFLRANHGTLLDTRGEAVHHVKLSRGEGAFQLRADNEARLATIRVFNGDPNLEDASIEIEFVPPTAASVEEQTASFGSGKRVEPVGTVGPEARFGVTEVSGIGVKLGRQLAISGVSTVGDLLAAEPARLAATLGTSVKRVEKFAELGRSLLSEGSGG
ncbi:MAG: helix-hairpin-helix domain-containing protein [bacterium]|nr:helix-hairpin-helix domain-containing protein [bacterium]